MFSVSEENSSHCSKSKSQLTQGKISLKKLLKYGFSASTQLSSEIIMFVQVCISINNNTSAIQVLFLRAGMEECIL